MHTTNKLINRFMWGFLLVLLSFYSLVGCGEATIPETVESTASVSIESEPLLTPDDDTSEVPDPEVITAYTPEPQYPLFELGDQTELWLDLNLIASGLSADHSVQGMAIGTVDGTPLSFFSLTDNVASDSGILILYDLKEMAIVASLRNQEIGHGNGVTFCDKDQLFYVACGGGSNGIRGIKAFNASLECVRTITLEGVDVGNPYGIAYDNVRDTFVSSTSGNKLTEFDYDFNVVRETDMLLPDDTYMVQSLFWDGDTVNQIFVAQGKVNSLLYKYRWNENEITFDSAELIDYKGELETGAVYGGQRYLAFPLLGGVLLKVTGPE